MKGMMCGSSSLGTVMRKNQPVDVFKSIDMHNGDPTLCWEWLAGLGGRDKRPFFSLNNKKVLAYRITYELMKGAIPERAIIRHSCDNPICCNPNHMQLGTHQDNMNDMKERERHGLPFHVVKAMKRLRAQGRTQQQVADLYGVSRETISAIETGRVHREEEDREGEDDDIPDTSQP
jgi:DNA-binding XRE family transcriptional regulator